MAYQERQKREAQARWEIGAYVRIALNSSILACTLADKTTANKLPDFPEMPFKTEKKQQEYTKEELEAERLKAYIFFQNLGKEKNVK